MAWRKIQTRQVDQKAFYSTLNNYQKEVSLPLCFYLMHIQRVSVQKKWPLKTGENSIAGIFKSIPIMET